MNDKLKRCWEGHTEPLHIVYHDQEWGVPLHNDTKFFEFLVLGSFQIGLSWWLILNKRVSFRKAFDNFEVQKVAHYNQKDIERIMNNPEVVRNKAKISAAIYNAQRFMAVQDEFGSFDSFIWKFVNGQPICNSFAKVSDLPTQSKESMIMSNDLKKRGFRLIGPTVCYAFMQATGLVNDHITDCFRHEQIRKMVAELR